MGVQYVALFSESKIQQTPFLLIWNHPFWSVSALICGSGHGSFSCEANGVLCIARFAAATNKSLYSLLPSLRMQLLLFRTNIDIASSILNPDPTTWISARKRSNTSWVRPSSNRFYNLMKLVSSTRCGLARHDTSCEQVRA